MAKKISSDVIDLLRRMWLIRAFEEKVSALYAERQIVGLLHLGIGQAGPFHESLKIASLGQLPVIFICENNGYAEFTPLSTHTKVERLTQHAKTYAIPASTVDGNDLFAVREAMRRAVEKCRAGKGPVFVECLTHRLRGHYEGDPAKYRELSQLAEWKRQDPIARVSRALKSKKTISDKKLESIESEARE